MGTTVYECGNPGVSGAHLYCHSRRDGKEGAAYLLINNSLTNCTEVELPKDAEIYVLDGQTMRASTMRLNGKELKLDGDGNLPELTPVKQKAGELVLAPGSCTFIVL